MWQIFSNGGIVSWGWIERDRYSWLDEVAILHCRWFWLTSANFLFMLGRSVVCGLPRR